MRTPEEVSWLLASMKAFLCGFPQVHLTLAWSNWYSGANVVDRLGRNFE